MRTFTRGTKEIRGFAGGSSPERATAVTICVVESSQGSWYCVKGSNIANLTLVPVETGVWVESLNESDIDTFETKHPIESVMELEALID